MSCPFPVCLSVIIFHVIIICGLLSTFFMFTVCRSLVWDAVFFTVLSCSPSAAPLFVILTDYLSVNFFDWRFADILLCL